jgi:ankyrin repeat protein
MSASGQGHIATVQALLAKGAKVNAKNQYGVTALMLAVARRAGLDTIQALLDSGADVNARSNEGGTAAMSAKEQGRSDILQLLCRHGGCE